MRFVALFCALFFSCASIALAQGEKTTIVKTICPVGTTVNTERVDQSDGGKEALSKVTGSNNFCTDELVTRSGALMSELKSEAYCLCPAQSEPNKAQKEQEILNGVGCQSGQRQPMIVFDIPKEISGCKSDRVRITKCAADLEEAYKDACKSGVNLTSVGASDPRSIVIAEAGVARSMPSLQLANGSDTLLKAFTATGVSEEQARDIIQRDPKGASEYISALANNDLAKAKTIASRLEINPDLVTEQQVSVVREQQKSLGGSTYWQNPAYTSGSVSFSGGGGAFQTSTGLPTQCGMPGIAGNFMLAESGCNRAPTNAINPYVGGAHHYLCSTWQGDVAATGLRQYGDCNKRFDPVISSQVVNARYALHEQTYGGQCQSAGVSVSSCMYAIHVFGEGGFRNMLAAQQRNPGASAASLCGSAVSAAACSGNQAIFTNGGTVQGVFGELDRRLSGGAVVNTYARGTGMSVPTGQSYSPFGGFTGQGQALVYNSQSPFSQVNVAGDLMQPLMGGLGLGQLFNNRPPQYQQPPYQQPPYQQPVQQPVQRPTQQPVQQPVVQPTPAPTSTPPVDPNPPKAVATVIIQPKAVAIGQSFTVSWTSVGTKKDCVLSADGKSVAGDESGTRRVTMQIAATVKYSLACTALAGGKVEASDTVTVK